MRRVLLCVVLLACQDTQKKRIEESSRLAAENLHMAKLKSLELAQEAARSAEQAAEVAIREAEQAKRELVAAKDELGRTTLEREKLQQRGRELVAQANAKIAKLEPLVDRMAATLKRAKDVVAEAVSDEDRQRAQRHLGQAEQEYGAAKAELEKLRALTVELAKSLAQ